MITNRQEKIAFILDRILMLADEGRKVTFEGDIVIVQSEAGQDLGSRRTQLPTDSTGEEKRINFLYQFFAS